MIWWAGGGLWMAMPKVEVMPMDTDDVVLAINKAIELCYEHAQDGKPVQPGSREASLIAAEAMNAVLQDAIEKRKRDPQ